MEKRYHLTQSGEPALCKAVKRNCPRGDANAHYGSADEARQEFEKTQVMPKAFIKLSKTMAYVLRHNPTSVGLALDAQGFVAVERLAEALHCTKKEILSVVAQDSKQRYEVKENLVRARQGHSLSVDLQWPTTTPPARLWHGTHASAVKAIFEQGLKPMQRHAVHLSETKATALQVGARRGEVVLLLINAQAMHDENFTFQKTANNVWLTAEVPAKFISLGSMQN